MSTPQMAAGSTLRQSWIIVQRDLKHWQREPWTPLFGIAFTIMLVLVFGYLFGGSIELPGGGDYLPYLMPGMFALAMMFGLEGTMTAIANDSKKGVTNRFRSLPDQQCGRAARSGRRRPDQLRGRAGRADGGWPADRLAGRRLVGRDACSRSALLLWLRFALLWLGIFLGLTLRGEGGVMAVQILVWPIGFLSNVFVSPEDMPAWLGFLAQWNPVSATAAACRELFGNPSGITDGVLAENAVAVAMVWPLVLAAVFIPLSARAYRRLSS